jgi:hypothetical protein
MFEDWKFPMACFMVGLTLAELHPQERPEFHLPETNVDTSSFYARVVYAPRTNNGNTGGLNAIDWMRISQNL